MNRAVIIVAGGALAACLALGSVAMLVSSDTPTCPGGKCPLPPPDPSPNKPKPAPKPEPKNPRRPCPGTTAGYQTVGLGSACGQCNPYVPWLPCPSDDDDQADKESWVNGRESNGEVLTADFPGSLYMSNIGSKRDGAGMCVATSITMLFRYLGLRPYYDFRDFAAREPGGAYSAKIDDQLRRYEKAKGITTPIRYLQYEGPDPGPILDAIDKANLPFAHSYGWSPRYNHRIAHMVANCKYNGALSAVLDNNPMSDFDPASAHMFEWMPKEEMVRRAKLGGGNMWIFCCLEPPPPPCPKVD